MQQDDAKQKSRFKWIRGIAAAVLVPGFGVPITKFVESHYDVSFFSPAISDLWGWILSIGTWLNQSFPMQLWMLLAITVGVAFVAVSGLLALREANRELNVGHANLNAVERKLVAAYSRINDLENPRRPEIPELNSSQQVLLEFMTSCEHQGIYPFVRDYPGAIGLTHLQVRGALDGLVSHGLVQTMYGGPTKKAILTPAGREFVLSAEGT
jgi:hypothetical protein